MEITDKMGMELFLPIIYLLVFILQIVFFVKAVIGKTKKKWIISFLTEFISMLAAVGMLVYYNNLPRPALPGLYYLVEILFSFWAAALYAIFFLITLITAFYVFLIRKKRSLSDSTAKACKKGQG